MSRYKETTSTKPSTEPPAYKRLADQLRAGLVKGDYADGVQLPTEAELVAELGLSRQTVRQAFAELVAERRIYRVRGLGTFANTTQGDGVYLRSVGSIVDLIALSLDTQLEVIQPLAIRTDISAAGRLQHPSDQIATAAFRRFHQELPFVVSLVFLPPSVAAEANLISILGEARSRTTVTVLGLLDRSSVGPVVGADQSVTATLTPAEHGPYMDCDPGEPVLRIDRVYFNRAGERMMLAVNYYNTHRYSYRVQLRS